MQQFLFASAQDNDAATLVRDCLHQIGEIPPGANLGFFANGEIYNGRLYGYTGVLTLFV